MGSSPVDMSLGHVHLASSHQYDRYQHKQLYSSEPIPPCFPSLHIRHQPQPPHYSHPRAQQAYIPTVSPPQHSGENNSSGLLHPLRLDPPGGLDVIDTGSSAGFTFRQGPTTPTSTLTSPSTSAPTPRHRSPQPASQESFMPYRVPSPRSPSPRAPLYNSSPPSLVPSSGHLVRSPSPLGRKFLSASLSSPLNNTPSSTFRTSTAFATGNNPGDGETGLRMVGPVRSPPRALSQSSSKIERTSSSSSLTLSALSAPYSRQHPPLISPSPPHSAMGPSYDQSFKSEPLPEAHSSSSSYASQPPHRHSHHYQRPPPQDSRYEYPQMYPTHPHIHHGRRHGSYSIGDHRPHQRYLERRNSYWEGDYHPPHSRYKAYDHYPPDHPEYPMEHPSRPTPPHARHYPLSTPVSVSHYPEREMYYYPQPPQQYHQGPPHPHPHSQQQQPMALSTHYEPQGSSFPSPSSPGATMPSRSGSTATGSTSRHSYTSPVSSVGEQEKRSLFLSKVSTGAKATKTTSTAATKASSPTQSKSGSRGGATGDLKTTRRRRRPNESYSIIIVKAIQSSQYQRLKLSEIYNYVSKEIPHMGNDKGWQNTVRHNLSHMKCFKRIMAKDAMLMGPLTTKEDTTDPPGTKSKGKRKAIKKGKGGYWILVPEHLEETSTQIRPKKNSMDHTTGSSASTSSSLALKGTGASSSPPAIGAPKRKGQDRAIPTHHQHRPPPLMMDHRGSLAGASSLWAQPRFPESHSFSQHPQSPPTSSQPHSHPCDRDMDVDKDVASMEIASMAIADTPYLQGSPYYPPGQHSSSRPTQSFARLPGVSQQQQSYPASSPSYSQCVGARGEEGEERLATCLSSPMSARSSRGSEEEDLDDDEDEDDDEEDEEEEYDEGEDSDDRSTGSRKDEGGGDARLGAGMSIHQLLN